MEIVNGAECDFGSRRLKSGVALLSLTLGKAATTPSIPDNDCRGLWPDEVEHRY